MMRALAISTFVAGATALVSSAPANAAVVVLGEMGINENSNSVNTANYNVTACDPCYVPFRLDSKNAATIFDFNAGVTAHSQSGFTLNSPFDFHIAQFTPGPPPVEGSTVVAAQVFPFGSPPSGFGNDDVVKAYAGIGANTLFAFVFSGAGGSPNGSNDAQTKLRITLTTVPLPAALPLLASGLLGLWGVRRFGSSTPADDQMSAA